MSIEKASYSGSRIPRLKRSEGDPIPSLGNARSPDAPQSDWFHSSKNVDISSGAHFNSARNIITINHHHICREPGSNDGSPTGIPPTGTGKNSPSSSVSTQTSPEVYARHLAVKGRGYPLWIPEPNHNLPAEYQRDGIRIGDVGIITPYGAFDFLFNVCVPSGDPINPEEMPNNFAPISPPFTSRDVRVFTPFKSNSHLASSEVKSVRRINKGLMPVFISSASEGAILTMPYGSTAEELRNVSGLRMYIEKNAVEWYKYLITVCGHEAGNGDLHLVVGYDKTAIWGMATFQNISKKDTAILDFKPVDENSYGPEYGWEYSGMVEVKSGPDLKDMDRLRQLTRDDGYVPHENQCLFIQTLNITLQKNPWDELMSDLGLSDAAFKDDASNGNRGPGSSSSSRPSTSSLPHNLTPERGSSGGTRDDTSAVSTGARTGSQSVQFSRSPQPVNAHPSKKINELFLKNVLTRLLDPDAKIGLIEDRDWMSVINEDDYVLPPAEVLYERIRARHILCQQGDATFFERNDVEVDETAARNRFQALVDERHNYLSRSNASQSTLDGHHHERRDFIESRRTESFPRERPVFQGYLAFETHASPPSAEPGDPSGSPPSQIPPTAHYVASSDDTTPVADSSHLGSGRFSSGQYRPLGRRNSLESTPYVPTVALATRTSDQDLSDKDEDHSTPQQNFGNSARTWRH